MFEGLKFAAQRSAKKAAIDGGLNVAAALHRLGIGRSLAGRGVIFTLHHVRPHIASRFEPNAHLEVTPEFLDSALQTILEAGYQPCALAELPSRLRNGDPDRPLAVFTLDDGYRDNAAMAGPIFSRHGVPFTVFATSGFSERTHTIWWKTLEKLVGTASAFSYDFGEGPEELRPRGLAGRCLAYKRIAMHMIGAGEEAAIERLNETARANGIDPYAIVDELVMTRDELKALLANPLAHLGAHTVSHRALSFLSRDTAIEEMTASAIFVSGITGRRTSVFAFPYGFSKAVTEREKRLAVECGFDLAVTTVPGTLNASSLAHRGGLPRVSLNGLYQKAHYVTALASGIPFSLLPRA